jgi:hypothetical protein
MLDGVSLDQSSAFIAAVDEGSRLGRAGSIARDLPSRCSFRVVGSLPIAPDSMTVERLQGVDIEGWHE